MCDCDDHLKRRKSDWPSPYERDRPEVLIVWLMGAIAVYALAAPFFILC